MNALSPSRKLKAPSAPEGRRIYAIGDIHGRADLLDRLLNTVAADAAGAAAPPILVCVGDYIDRGLQSRAVVDRLLGVASCGVEPIFLKGNHEAAMLAFMDQPEVGPYWLAIGGSETLFSYGVPTPAPAAGETGLRFAARALRAAMPLAHLRFFARLRLHVQLGDYLFVHAGLRPGEPLERQSEADLLEIRTPFLRSRRRWPFTVVHGHSPVETVSILKNRIAIDTGAYATGRLSAIRLEGTAVDVLTT